MIQIKTPYFDNTITELIKKEKALAACDGSVKEYNMGGYQYITDKEKAYKIKNKLFSIQWHDNTPKAAESVTLLDLIKVILIKSRHI